MRTTVTEREYRVFTYQSVDRVPDVEFGYWPQTIRRWLREGMAIELTPDEQNQMFLAKLDRYFGLDEVYNDYVSLRLGMHPVFDETVLERRETSVLMRASDGSIGERFLNDSEESSIPHFIGFPVKTPADWAAMKERYRFDDPVRDIPAEEIARVQQSARDGKMIATWWPGPYAMLRGWMGFEELSVAFFEYPEMIHEMIEHTTELALQQIRKLPAGLPIDHASWWEDMASKNGPFVSPAMFREFLQPQYHRIMTELQKHGCAIGSVDCDGNPFAIVRNWLEEGVNIMLPLEVMAGVDPYAWRQEFGLELRMRGGIGKEPLVIGGKAIDAELERIKPLLDQGGYIPHLDHLVPPNISYHNYCVYLEKKRKLIGKE